MVTLLLRLLFSGLSLKKMTVFTLDLLPSTLPVISWNWILTFDTVVLCPTWIEEKPVESSGTKNIDNLLGRAHIYHKIFNCSITHKLRNLFSAVEVIWNNLDISLVWYFSHQALCIRITMMLKISGIRYFI